MINVGGGSLPQSSALARFASRIRHSDGCMNGSTRNMSSCVQTNLVKLDERATSLFIIKSEVIAFSFGSGRNLHEASSQMGVQVCHNRAK